MSYVDKIRQEHSKHLAVGLYINPPDELTAGYAISKSCVADAPYAFYRRYVAEEVKLGRRRVAHARIGKSWFNSDILLAMVFGVGTKVSILERKDSPVLLMAKNGDTTVVMQEVKDAKLPKDYKHI